MPSDPITIYFENELEFVPFEGLHFDGDFTAELYHELRQPGAGTRYKNLTLDPSLLLSTSETTSGGNISRRCELDGHRISVIEKRTTSTVEQFADSVGDVLKAMHKVRVDNPPIYSQRCRIQALWKPSNCESPLILLAHHASRVLDKIDSFNRPPSFFGMRFRFAPAAEEDLEAFPDGKERNDFSTVRYEVYADDPDYIWIEVDSQRFVSSMKITQIDEISSIIRETHDFVTDNGVKFLEQFDLAESPTDDDSDNDEDQDYDSDDNESGDD